MFAPGTTFAKHPNAEVATGHVTVNGWPLW